MSHLPRRPVEENLPGARCCVPSRYGEPCVENEATDRRSSLRSDHRSITVTVRFCIYCRRPM